MPPTTVPSNGRVLFSDLRTAFEGATLIKFSDYYANATAAYTSNVSSVPNSGTPLTLSAFRGKTKSFYITISPAVSGRTNWDLIQHGDLIGLTPGTEYSITVPTSMSVRVDMWGAGGGFGTYGGTYKGGNGGYTYGNVTLAAGTSYKLIVGTGGQGASSFGNGGLGGVPGGGYGTMGDATGAGGGGYTGLFMTSHTHGNALMIAGGGGGATGYSGYPGNGGGSSGGNTSTGSSQGGSQVAGGNFANNGAAGSALQGGNGDTTGARTSGTADGGGGGGGYYGGQGGYSDAKPGAGGSGYINTGYVTEGVMAGGGSSDSQVNPPRSELLPSDQYAHGGVSGSIDGKPGYVKIAYMFSDYVGTLRCSNNTVEIRQVANAPDGGFLICGTSSATTNYHKNDATAGSVANANVASNKFVMKLSLTGAFSWSASIANATPEALCVSGDGSAYVCGWYNSSSIAFTNSDGSSYTIPISTTPKGNMDAFLVKYSSSGAVQWVTTMGGGGDDMRTNITTCDNNSVAVVGHKGYSGVDMTFTDRLGGTTTLPASASYDEVFIAKFDADGKLSMNGGSGWVARINGNNNVSYGSVWEPSSHNRVPVAKTNDHSIIVGCVSSCTSLYARDSSGNATTKNVASSGSNAYIVKYTASGTVASVSGNPWMVIASGASTESVTGIDVHPVTQDVVFTGITESATQYVLTAPDGTQKTIPVPANNRRNAYFASFNASGAFIASAYVNSSANTVVPRDIIACSDEGYLLSGSFYNKLDIYNSSAVLVNTIGSLTNSWNNYFVKYSRTGALHWRSYIRTLGNMWVGHATRRSNGYMVVGFWSANQQLTFTNASGVQIPINTYIAGTGSTNGFIQQFPETSPMAVPVWLFSASVTASTATSITITWFGSIYAYVIVTWPGGNTSGQQWGTSYTATGLTASTAYTFTVTPYTVNAAPEAPVIIATWTASNTKYPSSALSSASQTTTTYSGTNGVRSYTISFSTPYQYGTVEGAFFNSFFRSYGGRYSGSTYASHSGGVTTTTAGGTVYSGDWYQVYASPSFILTGIDYKSTSNYDEIASWVILGSNTGNSGSWQLITSQTRVTRPADGATARYNFVNATAYSYYRVVVTELQGTIQSTFYVQGLAFWGDENAEVVSTANRLSTTSIALSWTKTSRCSYVIVTWPSGGSSGQVSGLAYEITDLTAATTYDITLTPYTTDNSPGTPVTLSLTTAAALAVGTVTCTPANTSIAVSWTANNYAYAIVTCDNGGGSSGQITGTTHTLTGLSSGTTYNITVTPYTWNNIAGAAGSVSGTTTAAAPKQYPPTNMTGASTTISGQPYGNGTYIASASSTGHIGWEPWRAFHSATDVNMWHSNEDKYQKASVPAGVYIGAENYTTTTAGGVSYVGEWLQLQMPVAIAITGVSIRGRNLFSNGYWVYAERAPRSYALLGSNTGASNSWTLVQDATGVTHNSYAFSTTSTGIVSNTKFTYFRLVVREVGNDTSVGGGAKGTVNMSMFLQGTE